MESLYTKYRPQTFADVVGQKHVVTTLEHAVIEGRTSHAYLFCGPRGTGKTTMARLLAKALLCEQGPGHLPDGSCEECRLIAAGEHPDVYELDAASRTGVDNVRDEIISRVSFAPVRGAYKMYIIDEVHMLTTAAFNALLKTLEEPPSHVVFVLCTTDPQKIPETILSRVQRFDFHAISNADIQERLTYICEREGFGYDPEALELVVRHARGGMRDAISELEQLSVSGGGTISVDVARDVLGEVSASTLERMSLAMANRDVPSLFAQVESLVEVGRDLLQFTRALAARLRDVYVVAAIGASSSVVAASDDELPAISREARAFGSVDRVARALSLLSDASTEMRVAPNQRLVLEVALTKIARPQTELTLDALADRVASLERQMAALASQSARRPREDAPRRAQAETPAPQGGASGRGAAAAETKPAEQTAASPERGHQEARRAEATQASAPVQQASPVVSQPQAAQVHAQPVPQPVPTAAAGHGQTSRPRSATTPAPQVSRGAPMPAAPQPVRQAAPAEMPRQASGGSSAQAARPAPQPTAPAAPAGAGITDLGELQRRWKRVVDGLLSSHPQHGSLLMSSTIVADDGTQLTISLPKGSMFACRMLERPDVRAHVDPMIAQVFGPRKTRFAEGAKAPVPSAQAPAASAPAEPAPVRQERPASPAPAAPTATRASEAAAAPVSRAPQATPAQMPRQQAKESAPVAAPTAPQQRPVSGAYEPAATQPAPQQRAANKTYEPAAPRVAAAPARQSAPAPTEPAAPWNPAPLGYDDVPYDDADFTSYEEEFAFDPMLASQAAPSSMYAFQAEGPAMTRNAPAQRPPVRQAEPVTTAWQVAQPQRPTPVSQRPSPASQPQRPSPAPQPAPTRSQAPAVSPAPRAAQPASAPAPTAPQPQAVPTYAAPWEPEPTSQQPVASAAQPKPAPAPEPKPAPAPKPEPAPAPRPVPAPKPAPTPQPEAPKPEPATSAAPKRKRRAAGIPADIISMMTEIFGEGVTYTAMPPEEEERVLEDEAELVEDAESEFVEEPVDDADYDEED